MSDNELRAGTVTNGEELLAALRVIDGFFRDNEDFTEGGQFPIPEFILDARTAMRNADCDGEDRRRP